MEFMMNQNLLLSQYRKISQQPLLDINRFMPPRGASRRIFLFYSLILSLHSVVHFGYGEPLIDSHCLPNLDFFLGNCGTNYAEILSAEVYFEV